MQKNYFDKVHRWGIIWNIGALLMLLSIPVAISTYLGIWPELQALGKTLDQWFGLYQNYFAKNGTCCKDTCCGSAVEECCECTECAEVEPANTVEE